MFVLPLFVCEGRGVRREVSSMPGVFNLSVDQAVEEARAAAGDGVKSVLLFGLPEHKDAIGSAAYDADAPVQSAIRAIKRDVPGTLVITDVCLCEYTDHGHCGIIEGDEITNDPSVEQLVRAASRTTAASADVGAVGLRMDGRVGASVRRSTSRFRERRTIMSCAAKCVRRLRSVPRHADSAEVRRQAFARWIRQRWRRASGTGHRRRGHRDGEPAVPYLDVITRVKDMFGYPTAAYHGRVR